MIKRTFKIIFTLLKKNGTLFTVKYLKTCRLLVTRYMCGRPLLVNDAFVSSCKGWPLKFYFLKKYIDSRNTEKIKFCLTLFNISRTISERKSEIIPIDFSSITDGPKKSFKTVPASFIKEFIKNYELTWDRPIYEVSDFFISLKKGPHGPTILSITETVKYLGHSIMFNIYSLVGKDFFLKYIGPFISFVNHNKIVIPNGTAEDNVFDHKHNGRLSIISDPECKKRIIAIFDYYTQFTLKPIHKKFMFLLNKFPCDRTYTQDPFHKWEGNDPFYSLDLSSATDRFPVHLQEKLLSYLVSTKEDSTSSYRYAEAWRKLLTERVFNYGGTDFKYKVGQPMGAYSSWAAFTLSHHLVVQFCSKNCGKFPFTNYIILGDDIVIKDNEVARRYISFMNKLGVNISTHKTHVSKDTYEFAKRWIRYTNDGRFVELSPIPLKGIASNISNPFIVYTILFDYFITKGNMYLAKCNLITLVMGLFRNLKFKIFENKTVKTVQFSKKYLNSKLLNLDLSMRVSLGLETDEQIRKYLCSVLSNQDWYFIPSDSTILKRELFRVLGVSVYPSIKEGLDNLSKLKRRFMQYWALSFNNPNKLVLFPLFHAVNNWVKQMEKFTIDYKNNERYTKDLTLFQISQLVNFIDINELLMWDRNFHSNITFGGSLLSTAKSKLKDSILETFYYDLPGYASEVDDRIKYMTWSIETFSEYTKKIESGADKPLPQKQVEMFKELSKRHGYAFLQ